MAKGMLCSKRGTTRIRDAASKGTRIMPVQVSDSHRRIVSAVTQFDVRASKRPHHNPNALGMYMRAAQDVRGYVARGADLRAAVLNCFIGRLCDAVLKALELPKMTDREAKFGPEVRLPELEDMPRFKIRSTGNGASYTVTRLADGATLALHGDDALAFGKQLESTHDGYTDDDVCDEYVDVFSA